MTYKTSDDLDKAIKAAAKASPMDTGRAYAGFFFHRFLCRVLVTLALTFCSKEV